jgi:hypothetical protein
LDLFQLPSDDTSKSVKKQLLDSDDALTRHFSLGLHSTRQPLTRVPISGGMVKRFCAAFDLHRWSRLHGWKLDWQKKY